MGNIRVNSMVIGTMTVMEYADEHPNVRFLNTNFYNPKHPEIGVCVSDCASDMEDLGCMIENNAWWPLANGWERQGNRDFGWICRKNGRYLYITD